MTVLKGFVAGIALTMLAACATLPATAPAEDAAAIKAVLSDQQAAWNRGDIDAFMAGYRPGEDLRFASGGTVTRGWQSTLERYKGRYTNRAIMGELTFSDLEVDQVSSDAAVVHGAWALKRESDAPSGLFTLVLRKSPTGAWQIVSDTTTSAD
ncbi:MAG: nuclear transport factor 2 family protein [Pseudomonadota bacterium]